MIHRICQSMFNLLVVLFFAGNAHAQAYEVRNIDGNTTIKSRWDQEYAQDQLYASLNSIDYLIAPQHEKWMGISLEIIYQGDLDGDGRNEAVVSSHQGGNCCAPYYFVVSHRGDGFFSTHTHEQMYGYGINIVEAYDRKLIEVFDAVGSSDYPIVREELTQLDFTAGKLSVVSRLENEALIPVLIEVTGQDVEGSDTKIYFDVDGDGTDEEILVSYWERWGVANIVEIETSSMGPVTFSTGCSRIGFIATRTNGLHDVVCGRSDILRYDPQTNRYQ